jgi:RNA polymerase sigma-70 factor (ECF subfamily)
MIDAPSISGNQTETQTENQAEHQAVAEFLETHSDRSFTVLFELLYPKVVCFFMVRGTPAGTAEELAQDVLTAVYRHAAALRDRQLFFGWLFRIARNQLLQSLRKQRRNPDTVALEDLDAVLAAEIKIGDEAADLELREWFECLERQERQIMLLRYVEELGYQEIATALEMPLGTVKWKIFSAKAKLAASLKGKQRLCNTD